MTLDEEPYQLPDVVNDGPFEALSLWWCHYGSIGLQNKNVQKANPY